nr:unnamed protein product [Callosobruchus chinensis]
MRDSGVVEQVVVGPKPIRVYRKKRKKSSHGSSLGARAGVTITIFVPLHTLAKMTSNGEKCGLSSILPMSCRSRAEALARSLHTRLKNLGAQNNNNTDESSWLAAHENPIATSQPRHMLDFCLLEPTVPKIPKQN